MILEQKLKFGNHVTVSVEVSAVMMLLSWVDF